MGAESVRSLQAQVGTIESVDAASASIGQAITEQGSLGKRVSASLESISSNVKMLSHEIREAAQGAVNSGMLSELVLEIANSVAEIMTGLRARALQKEG